MANEENLKPFTSAQNREEASKNGKKGGVASGRSRRRKRALKEAINELLEMPLNEGKLDKIKTLADVKGANITVQEAMILAQLQKALKGDTRAYNAIMDYKAVADSENTTEKSQTNILIDAINASAEVWNNNGVSAKPDDDKLSKYLNEESKE